MTDAYDGNCNHYEAITVSGIYKYKGLFTQEDMPDSDQIPKIPNAR